MLTYSHASAILPKKWCRSNPNLSWVQHRKLNGRKFPHWSPVHNCLLLHVPNGSNPKWMHPIPLRLLDWNFVFQYVKKINHLVPVKKSFDSSIRVWKISAFHRSKHGQQFNVCLEVIVNIGTFNSGIFKIGRWVSKLKKSIRRLFQHQISNSAN